MSAKDIRHSLLTLAASNAYLASSIYDRATVARSKEATTLAMRLSAIDTIANPFELLEVKHAFANGKHAFTRNKNLINCLIYGYWKSIFPDTDFNEALAYPSIEHGLILADDIFEEIKLTGRCSAVTFGEYRQGVIRSKAHIPAFAIGPYIQYAKPFYEAPKFEDEKGKLGKTLLVFPSHGTDDSEVTRSCGRQIEQIRAQAETFDSVLVSVFWWDLDDPMIEAFSSEGFKIVCAGFRDDPSFVSRQRSIIELSDYVLSDGIGTHIGFCRALNRPVKLMNEGSTKQYGKWATERANSVRVSEKKIISAIELPESRQEKETLDFFWGYGIKRSKEELRAIGEISKDIVKRSKGFRAHAWRAAEHALQDYQMRGDALKEKLLSDALGIGGDGDYGVHG